MKKSSYFNLCLFSLLLLTFCVSDGIAQGKVAPKTKPAPVKKNGAGTQTLKDAVNFIVASLRSQVSYLEDKENVSCPNQITRKLVYEQGVFTEPNLEIKLVDDTKRTVCSVNLTGGEKVTSSSQSQDEVQVSIPLKDLDVATIKTTNCPLDIGYKRTDGNCFSVSFETNFGKKSIKIDKTNSYWFNEKKTEDRKLISYTTNKYQLFFGDEETAGQVVNAFLQAVKLSNGKK